MLEQAEANILAKHLLNPPFFWINQKDAGK